MTSLTDRRRVRAVVMAVVLAGLACGANLELTRNGPLLATDSASYLSAAQNLSTGRGLTTTFNDSTSVYHPAQVVAFHGRVPFVHFEPLYPLLIAALHSATLGDVHAARALGALAIVAIVLLLCGLAFRAVQGYLPLVLVIVVITVLGPSGQGFVSGNLLELSGQVLSEPLFYALSLGALFCGARFLQKGTNRELVVTLLLVAAVVLTRYVGFSVAIAIALATLATKKLPWRRRLQSAALMFGVGLFALIGWPALEALLSGGSTPRQIAVHLHPHLFNDFLSTAAAWFFPTNWPGWVTETGALALLAISVISPFTGGYYRHSRRAPGPPAEVKSLLRLLAFFLLSYLLVVAGSTALLDASLSLNQRVLGPVQVTSYLLLVSIAYWAVRSRAPARMPFAPLAVVLAVALVVAVPNAASAARQLGHPYLTPRPTPAMVALARLPAADLIFTNEPSGVYIYAHRGSVLSPVRRYVITTHPNPTFKADVEYVGTLLRRHPGVVALVPDIQASLLDVAELEHWAGLMVTRRFADGSIFFAPPGR